MKFNRCFRRCAALATLFLASAGCESTTKTSFDVTLQNAGKEPVTVWLTKSGGPEEIEWLAPEALANSRAASIGMVNGVVIPPGKTGEIGPIEGKFDRDAFAVLRVYSGQLSLDQILATPVDGKLRVDIPLREGVNQLRVNSMLPLQVDRVGQTN